MLASKIGQANVGLANEKLGPAAAEYVKDINLASQDLDPYTRLELNLKISAALFATEGGANPHQVLATLREAAHHAREHRQMKADRRSDGGFDFDEFRRWFTGVNPNGTFQYRNPLGGLQATLSGSFSGAYYLAAGTVALRLKDRYARLSNQISLSLPVDAMDALQIAGGVAVWRTMKSPAQVNGGRFNVPVGPSFPLGQGVVPGRHNANFRVLRDGKTVAAWREVSGAQSPEALELGWPKGSQSSHTEYKGLTRGNWTSDDTIVITGQKRPRGSCQQEMNLVARETGATIIYHWRENGRTQTWQAGVGRIN